MKFQLTPLKYLLLASLCVLALLSVPLKAQTSIDSDLDNAHIIQMSQKGLGDDVIIARIKTTASKFSLADDDLADLKKANVSDRVVAAMIESTRLTAASVKIDGNPVQMHVIGEQKVGGRLGHEVTLGIKSVKNKAYLQGQHASVIASRKPVIEIELPANDTIDSYVVVEMDGKGDRRELEIGSAGGTVGEKKGVRADRIVHTSTVPAGGRRFKMSPISELKKGEYIVYVLGSADYERGVFGHGYDFTVE